MLYLSSDITENIVFLADTAVFINPTQNILRQETIKRQNGKIAGGVSLPASLGEDISVTIQLFALKLYAEMHELKFDNAVLLLCQFALYRIVKRGSSKWPTWLLHETGRLHRWNTTLSQNIHGQEVAASAIAFRLVSESSGGPLSLSSPTPQSFFYQPDTICIKHPISLQKVTNTWLTPLGLPVSMDGVDCQL
ncbi:hypothetical protein EVAR_16779_1 [Eumeta japonica]|uniref:Uncharacterized protein n=1 Tax=Eumeta variegata TaxID=151549 RepID=A0A4C1UKX6_EUMVA|nr:hypothetical protein EVAR_16779_1 [Eumeta japonica]